MDSPRRDVFATCLSVTTLEDNHFSGDSRSSARMRGSIDAALFVVNEYVCAKWVLECALCALSSQPVHFGAIPSRTRVVSPRLDTSRSRRVNELAGATCSPERLRQSAKADCRLRTVEVAGSRSAPPAPLWSLAKRRRLSGHTSCAGCRTSGARCGPRQHPPVPRCFRCSRGEPIYRYSIKAFGLLCERSRVPPLTPEPKGRFKAPAARADNLRMDIKKGAAQPAKDGDAQPAGHIVHDARGNAVWKRTSADSTSTMLRRLELPGLTVEGQGAPPAPRPAGVPVQQAQPKTASAAATEVKHGYNPYDQHIAIRKPTTPKGPIGRRKPKIT